MRNVNVVSAGEKWSEKKLANPTLMLRAEKRTGKKGNELLYTHSGGMMNTLTI